MDFDMEKFDKEIEKYVEDGFCLSKHEKDGMKIELHEIARKCCK